MHYKKMVGLLATALLINLGLFAKADALTMSIKCDVTGTTRSTITVVGPGLSGRYWARVSSGSGVKSSAAKTSNASGLATFIFDSNAVRIAAGATAIPANFIQGQKVTAYIRRATTNGLVVAMLATCTAH